MIFEISQVYTLPFFDLATTRLSEQLTLVTGSSLEKQEYFLQALFRRS